MRITVELEDLSISDLSNNEDLVLFLVQKELQVAKLMMELDRVGLDHMPPSTFIEDLIFSSIGLEILDGDVREEYYKLIESYACKIKLFNSETASEQALELYWVLREKFSQSDSCSITSNS